MEDLQRAAGAVAEHLTAKVEAGLRGLVGAKAGAVGTEVGDGGLSSRVGAQRGVLGFGQFLNAGDEVFDVRNLDGLYAGVGGGDGANGAVGIERESVGADFAMDSR